MKNFEYLSRQIKTRPSKKIANNIKTYSQKFAEKLDQGKISNPGNGDCWGCLFHDQDGKEAFGSSHLLDHIRENYFVPSLLVNALNEYSSQLIKWYCQDRMNGGTRNFGYLDCKKEVSKILQRYLMRRLSIAS